MVRSLFVILILAALLYLAEERLWQGKEGSSQKTQETAEEDHAGKQGEKDQEGDEAREESGNGTPYYCRELLSGEDADLYDEVLEILENREEGSVSTRDPNALQRIYTEVLADHPEIFWTDGYSYTTYQLAGRVTDLVFSPNYDCTKEEQAAFQDAIDEKVAEILAGCPEDADDYQKLLYIYDYVIQSTEYDTSADYNQDIRSVFLEGESVCGGYAKAAQLLCQELGIEAVEVAGTANGGSHGWDLVLADGSWYYLDPTFGDGSFRGETGSESDTFVDYDYFLVTTEDILTTHTPDDTFPLPECTAVSDNYYVRQGLYFTEYDRDRLKRIIDAAYESGENVIRFRCATKQLYEEMKQSLLENQEIYEFLHGATSLTYSENDSLYTLMIFLS